MSVVEYLQQLYSAKADVASHDIWAMFTARNALVLSTVCGFVVVSLALWSQPRRAALLKRTVDNVLEAGFGTGNGEDDGHVGKPLFPRFIRRLFYTQLPQFTVHSERSIISHELEKVAVPRYSAVMAVCSGADNGGQVQHVGGGAKRRRRHRRHRGNMSVNEHRQRPKHYRSTLMTLLRHVADSNGGAAVFDDPATVAEKVVEDIVNVAAFADNDPVVDATQPRRYQPAPIGHRSTGVVGASGGVSSSLFGLEWDPQNINTDADLSLFSNEYLL
ncbi:hypothetical protein GGI21_001520 [Coemansia aciculifera]|nr:hypothetical protein GGI21_001520 [Coemansia aciculifera]